MKTKEYMTPEMEVVDMKIQGILCVSGDIDDNTEGGQGGGNVDNPNKW